MMSWVQSILLVLSTLAFGTCQVAGKGLAPGFRTIVILDDQRLLDSHSLLFDDLKNRGHSITFHSLSEKGLNLIKYNERKFDNLMLFSSRGTDLISFDSNDLIQFSEMGGNIFFALGNTISEKLRVLIHNFGANVNEDGSVIRDYFNVENNDTWSQNSIIRVTTSLVSQRFTGIPPGSEILYHGNSLALDPENHLAFGIVKAKPTSCTPGGSSLCVWLENNYVTAAIQARNNARITITASISVFSNAFFSREQYLNRKFSRGISRWNFGETGVMRIREVLHHKGDGTSPDVTLHEKTKLEVPTTMFSSPEIARNSLVYRIKDEIHFSVRLEELYFNRYECTFENTTVVSDTCSVSSSTRDLSLSWNSLCVDDMQLEFAMLDVYVRVNMTCDFVAGRMSARFIAPDAYGVFKFRIFYQRPGYSVLHYESQVSLRPYKHDEYDRFIPAASPYYFSAIAGVVAFLIFSVTYLFIV